MKFGGLDKKGRNNMALNSQIEWCDHSHNFWMGCKKVSLGCINCYAERDMKRFGRNFDVVRKSQNFRAPMQWLKNGKAKPGDKIFVNSWSDFFIEGKDRWRDEAIQVIYYTPELIYLILTKRIEIAIKSLNSMSVLPKNIWLGVSVENQITANKRIPLLAEIPFLTKFVSFEPLLGPIDISEYVGYLTGLPYPDMEGNQFEWALIGGESDYKSPRPCKMEWIRDLIGQCEDANIPVFLKQLGGSKKINGHWGGNKIFGKTWKEFPC